MANKSTEDTETRERQRPETARERLPDGSEPKHLMVVNYEKEPERNRAVQTINKHTDEKATRPQGTIRYVPPETDLETLTEELATRVQAQNIHLFEIEEIDISVPEAKQTTVTHNFDEPQENLENMLNFIITNNRGRLTSPKEREYEIASRKGRVGVTYETGPQNESVAIHLEGEAEAVEHLKKTFTESHDQIAASESEAGEEGGERPKGGAEDTAPGGK